ncbi:Cache 3/Cache 2 fusion domain-containing protein, partial [Burkholderia sp. BCC1640]|uniref:Cache 3/Cache 2 fusion domain-containing protein n=1 Tax=Burkholderia sp. BCC1640 TaxID=2676294 RepID=UPI00326684CC
MIDASGGADRGKFVVHPSAEGKLAEEANLPVRRMLEAGQGRLDYVSADAALGEREARAKYVVFQTVPEWHWLGERRGNRSLVAAAAAVSTPLDVHAGGRAISQGFSMVYTRSFLKTLKLKGLAKLAQHPGIFD